MDLNMSTDQIFDDQGNPVSLRMDITEQIEMDQAEEMFSAIVQTGQLPDGIYTFRVTAVSENGERVTAEDILNISNPATLQLVSPGGILADTTLNEIYTTFPVFQWESDPCNINVGCEYFIRVAEFNSQEHSSVDQAVESVTRLPLDQSIGFEPVGFGVTTFQYPTDAGDLEAGKVYVWQIRKDLVTTAGTEQLLSDIRAFKVKDFTTTEAGASTEDTSPTGIALRALIGDEMAEQIFGSGGEAEGAFATGNITLNDESVDVSFVQSLVSMGVATLDEDGNEIYRPAEIISVEVSE